MKKIIFLLLFNLATITVSSAQETINDTTNKSKLSEVPSYPGGLDSFYEYLILGIEKIDPLLERKMYIRFVIEEDGCLSEVTILRGIDTEQDKLVAEIIINSSKWIPAYHNNKPVRSNYSLPLLIIWH